MATIKITSLLKGAEKETRLSRFVQCLICLKSEGRLVDCSGVTQRLGNFLKYLYSNFCTEDTVQNMKSKIELLQIITTCVSALITALYVDCMSSFSLLNYVNYRSGNDNTMGIYLNSSRFEYHPTYWVHLTLSFHSVSVHECQDSTLT